MGSAPRTLEDVFGHRFQRTDLLVQALTHSSTGGDAPTYERLEFLGDRVLGLIVARILYDGFPSENEGSLAPRFTKVVQRDALARVAETIGLGSHMILSDGEDQAGGRTNPALLADTCEAVIAALYMDGGLETAERFVRRYWSPLIDEDEKPPQDPKTALQEWAQGRGLPLPDYQETSRSGPDHAPVFSIQATVQGHPSASGRGASKRAAEQDAALALLKDIRADHDD